MLIRDNAIDGGKGFDWGKVSTDYAKYFMRKSLTVVYAKMDRVF